MRRRPPRHIDFKQPFHGAGLLFVLRKEDAVNPPYVSIVGDSIATLEGYLPPDFETFYSPHNQYLSGICGYDDTWWGQVIRRLGGHLLVNASFSGSCVCRSPHSLSEYAASSDLRTGCLHEGEIRPDHILVFIGTNDRGYGFPLYSEDKSDPAVFENAYGIMLDKLKRNYPAAAIWCCTFGNAACSRDPQFTPIRTFYGRTREEWHDAVCRVAAAKGVHTVDLDRDAPPFDTFDGLHPNLEGMRVIADAVIAAMERAGALRRE